ncbi:MAG: LysE family translocator [Terracidiphilus sp.]|jgi:threonine/homoserine/homoserine lactone efflux protein
MIDAMHVFAFLLPVIGISLVPGPDTVYVLNRSLSQGRLAGLVAALGSCTGVMCHISLSVAGFSALLMASAFGFMTVKIAGAGYLIYLGIRMLGRPGATASERQLHHDTHRAVWFQGALTNVLNPKVAVFFLAFIPQFIDPRHGQIPQQFFLLGVIFNAIGTSWLCSVALSSGKLSEWLRANPLAVAWQQRVTGAVFIAFAAKLAFQ